MHGSIEQLRENASCSEPVRVAAGVERAEENILQHSAQQHLQMQWQVCPHQRLVLAELRCSLRYGFLYARGH